MHEFIQPLGSNWESINYDEHIYIMWTWCTK